MKTSEMDGQPCPACDLALPMRDILAIWRPNSDVSRWWKSVGIDLMPDKGTRPVNKLLHHCARPPAKRPEVPSVLQ